MSAGQAECDVKECGPVTTATTPSLLEGLKQKRRIMQNRMNDLDAAINALEQNPQVATVIDLISKVRY